MARSKTHLGPGDGVSVRGYLARRGLESPLMASVMTTDNQLPRAGPGHSFDVGMLWAKIGGLPGVSIAYSQF